ncbi:hypothetical protein PP7435_CHR4-1686 [Komagataella phaffii CBS 7435]|uniref:Uncharacterized protein n=2 Tax=Komagataella phaffii TaxID=460519 RepID=C4R7F3_KOMPG|nr:Hypothetical protein PAS_chr4_0291 [Komagataella phaffii GS115]CAH2451098.1 hypothetical protein BQ9382_C4-3725 [Komagataella phaffii CBS 7435]CAY71528.1 Hypothetical protein PAS_chr4_0291 [Komagataella phaffii GS115]SCV12398.1 hypothetical protein PP7435_CHR4-1686 [Komagataella phaffii CBS 7435]
MHAKVRALYKELIYLARFHPNEKKLKDSIKAGFLKNKNISSENETELFGALAHGRYMCRELTSLYELQTYRAVKRKYYT